MIPQLQAIHVEKSFHNGTTETKVLKSVSISVEKGEFVAIVGPSGCGKSTLLHLLGGLDLPDSGEILLNGNCISKLDELQRTLLRRRQIGFIFQKVHLLPMLKALDNVMVPLRLDDVAASVARDRAERALATVGMSHRIGNRPGELSGGEAQRVAIARAIVSEPTVLLADEPTGALDSVNSQMIIDLFRNLVDEHGQTLVVVTHDPGVAARADRVIQMKDGRVVGEQITDQNKIQASADANH